MLASLFHANNNIVTYYAFLNFLNTTTKYFLNTEHNFGWLPSLHIPSYRFLLIFKQHPELFQFSWDRRARQLQSLDDVTSVPHLVFCDESVGKALTEKRSWRPPVREMDTKNTVNNNNNSSV